MTFENNVLLEPSLEDMWWKNMRSKLILCFIVFVIFGIGTGIIILYFKNH